MNQAEGQRLGPYEILSPVGAGGMGEVYSARDTRLGRDVAVKVLPEAFAADPERLARFQREAKILAALNHPNILAIYDVGEQEGITYVVTELLRGRTLGSRIAEGPLPPEDAVEVAFQMARALAAAHEKGIVHRDLKPENVFLLEEDRVKILDFGIARLETGHVPGAPPPDTPTITFATMNGVILGTPEYMSPEQVKGEAVDGRSDLFAFGCILREMLTGRRTFSGDSVAETIAEILKQDPPPLEVPGGAVPPALEELVRRCLAKDPDGRPRSAREVAEELKRLRGQASSLSLSALTAARPAGGRRRKAPWIAGGAALLLALAAAAGAWWLRRDRGGAPPPGGPGLQPWKASVAVLPFRNLSPDPEQEYFCDGMTEQIITNLAQLPDLKVIARSSVMGYRNTEKDARQIAGELGVANLLQGSVRKSGDRIRVSAQLLRAKDGTHLWARDFDRDLKDVFAVQDEVAQAIAGALKITLSGEALTGAGKSRPASLEAYEYYLKAKHYGETVYMATHDEKDYQKAVELGRKAVELDPRWAPGYFGLGYLCELRWIATGDRAARAEQVEYIKKAYELDPDMADANGALGFTAFMQGRTEEAFALCRRALELNPNSALSLNFMGMFYTRVGLFEEALDLYSRSLALDPKNFFVYSNAGFARLYLGQPKEALRLFTEALKAQPNNVPLMIGSAQANLMGGNLPEADRWILRLEGIPPLTEATGALRALYLALEGKREQALAMRPDFEVLAALRMGDEALTSLRQAIQKERQEPNPYKRDLRLTYLSLARIPYYDSLRPDPRFQAILADQKAAYEEAKKRYRR